MALHCYIDGLNLYYGLLKGTDLKWLDLVALSRRLAGRDPEKIRYFTARVKAFPGDPGAPQRQDVYLRALGTFRQIEIHEGQFMMPEKDRVLASSAKGSNPKLKYVRILNPEEKGSDVNLASYLLLDVFRGDCTEAFVFTNDSDLATPISMAVTEFGVPVTIVNPHRKPASALKALGIPVIGLKRRTLTKCQLPDPVTEQGGRLIHKPPEWT